MRERDREERQAQKHSSRERQKGGRTPTASCSRTPAKHPVNTQPIAEDERGMEGASHQRDGEMERERDRKIDR